MSEWNNRRNAAAFAAECVRKALPLYKGDDLEGRYWRAVAESAISFVDEYVAGGEISSKSAEQIAASLGSGETAPPRIIIAASWAVRVVELSTRQKGNYSRQLYGVMTWTVRAGADKQEIDVLLARWVVKDLCGDRVIDEELRQAAGAAIIAGDENLAREIVNRRER